MNHPIAHNNLTLMERSLLPNPKDSWLPINGELRSLSAMSAVIFLSMARSTVSFLAFPWQYIILRNWVSHEQCLSQMNHLWRSYDQSRCMPVNLQSFSYYYSITITIQFSIRHVERQATYLHITRKGAQTHTYLEILTHINMILYILTLIQ